MIYYGTVGSTSKEGGKAMRHRKPIARIMAIPAKGQPQRGMALVSWGMAGALALYGGAFYLTHDDEAPARKRGGAPRSAPDAAAEHHESSTGRHDSHGATESTSGPDDGTYVPTFFDGHGGVAGVPLTPEQRKAVMREAQRRGISTDEAREMAYGDGGDEGVFTHTATGMYRQVAPMEYATLEVGGGSEAPSGIAHASAPSQVLAEPEPQVLEAQVDEAGGSAATADTETNEEAASAQGSTSKPVKPKAKPKKAKPKKAKPAPSLTDRLKTAVKDVVPGSVKQLGDVLPKGLNLQPLSLFMADISQPGTEVQVEVSTINLDSDPAQEAVQVTATAQVSQSVAVTAEVVAPVKETAESTPSVVAVTLTDPSTDEVIVAPKPIVVDRPSDVSGAAIGAIVDTVVDASADHQIPTDDVPAVINPSAERVAEEPAPEQAAP
ncbi:hypothetical protein ACWDCL_02045 [Streptomyces sp. NPDC001009]